MSTSGDVGRPGPSLVRIADLFELARHPERLSWESFRPGIRIHRLYGDQTSGPSAALLWYEPNTVLPAHEHPGYEHLLILSETQVDEGGETPAGTFVINPPGSRHQVTTPHGGMVLAIWEKPVRFVQTPAVTGSQA